MAGDLMILFVLRKITSSQYFLYDMEIIEFVKPLDDTELDDFLYGFVISWDTPEELLRVRFEVLFIIGWATIQVNCILTT
jgi:hypothetical protein